MGPTVGDAVYRLCRDRCEGRILMERLFQEERTLCKVYDFDLVNMMSDMIQARGR